METPKRKRRSNERMTPGSAKRHRGTSSARNSNLLLDIHVKDFMCHKSLELKFGERANFIVGQNGSGKSAILNSIQAVFGAAAKATNRKKASEWIRTGNDGKQCGSADVIIRLNNNYAGRPFEIENYGNVLELKRHITNTSSSYSIKNVNGKFEKVNMGKIKAIANHFNIQAANPVHIMTQESTKDFLNAKSKKHKYNLFMQGTTLTQTKENYDCAGDEINKMRATNLTELQNLEVMKTQKNELLKKVSEYSRVKSDHHALEERKKRLVWCPVVAAELELQEKDKFYKVKENKRLLHKEKADEYQKKIHELHAENEASTDQLETLKHKAEQIRDKLTPLCQRELQLNREINDQKSKISAIEEKDRKIEKELEELDKFREKSANPELRAKLEATRAELRNITQQIDELKRKQEEEGDKKYVLDQEIRRLKTERQGQQDTITKDGYWMQRRETEIRALKAANTQKSNPFGSEVPKIQAEIKKLNQQGKWVGAMPIGPVGDFIKVGEKYKDYIGVAEWLTQKKLTSYLVFSSNDEKLLMSVLKKYLPQNQVNGIQVTTMTWNTADIESNANFRQSKSHHQRYPTVYEVFDFSHPMAKRFLCEFVNIQGITMIPTLEEATVCVQERCEVKFAYTFALDEITPSRAKTRNAATPKSRYFTADNSEYIIQQEAELEQKRLEVKQKEDEVERFNKRLRELTQELRALGGEGFQQTIRKLEYEKRRTQEWIDDNDIVTNDNDDYYRTEMMERETILERNKQKIQDYQNDIQIRKGQKETVLGEIAAEREAQKEIEKQIDNATQSAEAYENQQNTLHNKRDYHNGKMREYKTEANRFADQKKDLEKKIERLIRKASESCPRPDAEHIAQDENTERRLIQTLESNKDAERDIMRDGF